MSSVTDKQYHEALARLLKRAVESSGQLVLEADEALDLKDVLVGVYDLLADREELVTTRALMKRAADARAQTPGSGSKKDTAACEVLGFRGPPRGREARATRAKFHVVEQRPLLGRWLRLTREECAAHSGAPIPERLRTARRAALNTLSEELDEDFETTARRLRLLRAKLREALEGERDPNWRSYFAEELETLSDPNNPAYVPDGRDEL